MDMCWGLLWLYASQWNKLDQIISIKILSRPGISCILREGQVSRTVALVWRQLNS